MDDKVIATARKLGSTISAKEIAIRKANAKNPNAGKSGASDKQISFAQSLLARNGLGSNINWQTISKGDCSHLIDILNTYGADMQRLAQDFKYTFNK